MSKAAVEALQRKNIERCDECRCAIGDDWEFVDFSNKNLIACPQCGELYNMGDE